MRLVLVLAAAALLAGCETAAERTARYEAGCVNRGFTPKTDAMRLCVMQREAAAEAAFSDAMRGMEMQQLQMQQNQRFLR